MRPLVLCALVSLWFAGAAFPQTPAGLIPASSAEAWQRAGTAARRAGYDFSDVRVARVYLQAPGTRLRKEQAPEGAVILHPRTLDRADDSLIDYAVDEKYGGDRALKLAIKAVNRLLRKQRQELEQLRTENRITAAQEAEVTRRLLQ